MVPGVPRFTGLKEKGGEGCGNWRGKNLGLFKWALKLLRIIGWTIKTGRVFGDYGRMTRICVDGIEEEGSKAQVHP